MKCLEFHLPSGAAGMAAGMTRSSIGKKIRELVDKKLITGFKTHTEAYKFYVWFNNDHDYTTFFLVWTPYNSWQNPKVIEKDYPEGTGPNKTI